MTDFQTLSNALRSQFGTLAVFHEGGDLNTFVFMTPARNLFIRFLPTPNDVVPVRAVECSRRGGVSDVNLEMLARVDIQTNGTLTAALLNGHNGGEDTTLAQWIADARAVVTP